MFVSTATGEIDLAGSTLGTYVITYSSNGPCPNTFSFNITITTAPSATFSYTGPYCQSGVNPLPTFPVGSSAGVFSSTAGLVFISTATGEIDLLLSTPGTYTVTNSIAAAGGCIASSASTTVTIDVPATANAGLDAAICAGSTYTTLGSIGGSASSSTWTTSGSGSFSGSVYTPSVADISAGSVTLTITTDNPAGACGAVSDAMILTINSLPNANAGFTATLTCDSTSLLLIGSSTTSGVTFNWAGAGIVSGGTTATPIVNATGTYTVTVTNPANSCTSTATVVVSSNTTPPVADAGALQNIGCGTPTATLNGSGSSSGATISYTWTTIGGNIVSGGSTTSPVVNQGGVYTITVTNTSNGCSSTDTVSVLSSPTPVASFTATPLTGTPPLTVNFANSSTNSNTYFWDFGNGTTSTATSPGDIYNTPGTYIVTLIASFNSQCPDTTQATIIVYDNFTIFIPNTFTPNGDLNNDLFILTSTGVADFKGDIYDRWGLKLFEMTNISTGWDGKTKAGMLVPDGTYFYVFNVKGQDGTEHAYKGFINLLR